MEPGLGERLIYERLAAGSFTHWTVWMNSVGLPSCELTTCRRGHVGLSHCVMSDSQRQDPDPNPCLCLSSNSSLGYLAFLESLARVLESAPKGDSVLLQGIFSAHVGNDIVTWKGMIGRNSCSDLNLRGVLLMDFCTSCGLSIPNTMFKCKSVRKRT